MKKAYRCVLAAVLATTAASCGYSEDVATGEKNFEVPGDGGDKPDCVELGCDGNSPHMGPYLYYALDSTGREQNDAKITFESVTLPGVNRPLFLDVVHDQIIISDHYKYSYTSVVGAVMTLARGDEKFFIRIVGQGHTHYWTDTERLVPTYMLEWAAVPESGKMPQYDHLCPDTVAPSDDDDGDPQLERHTAVVFEGDLYDGRRRTVQPGRPGWFNIGCARTAVAKMHLLQHTDAGSDERHKTTIEERTTMLKMITDDICGTGQAFTIVGEKVSYMERQGFRTFDLSTTGTLEAIWDEHGAVCLDEPRRAFEDPDVWNRILATCKLPPPCDNAKEWWKRGYGISANPRPRP